MVADAVKMYYEGGRLEMPTAEQAQQWTKNIFVLEDKPERQDGFGQKLGPHYFLTIADNARDAIDILSREPFDIISLDGHLGKTEDTEADAANSGATVAKFIAENNIPGHVIVHCNEGYGFKHIRQYLPQSEHRPEFWK